MNNIKEVMWVINIGTLASSFLLNTCRVLQAIELCQECLILLNNTAQANVDVSAYKTIYLVMFIAYCLLNDHTSGIECGRKLLDFPRTHGLDVDEGLVTFQLAKLHQFQSKYKEATGLYKTALSIMLQTGDRN